MSKDNEDKNNLIGEPFLLARLIDYQPNSVVSREIISRQSGSLTIFAFDQGQGLSEHTAPFDALVHIVDGEALVIISGEPHELAAGDAIIMPANKPHALKASRKFKMLLVMIKG